MSKQLKRSKCLMNQNVSSKLNDANRLQANIEQPDNSDYEYGRY